MYFRENFKTHTTPGRKEYEKAIELSKLKNGVLYRRSLETVKKKVWNEMRKRRLTSVCVEVIPSVKSVFKLFKVLNQYSSYTKC